MCHTPASGHSLIKIHELEIDNYCYGGLGVIVCPEWHSPVVFIAWIEENISPRQEQRYPADAFVFTDND
jgi:hypothetical protein